MAKKILTRGQILEAEDLEWQDLNVPEWGGTVIVRGLTGKERDQYEAGILRMRGKNAQLNLQNARARLVVMGTIDEEGEPVFTMKDVDALGDKSAAAIERIASAIQRLSGLAEADVQQMVENFTIDQNGDSTSS